MIPRLNLDSPDLVIEIEETLISMTKVYRDKAANLLSNQDPFSRARGGYMLEEIARLEYLLALHGITIDPIDNKNYTGDH